MAITLGSQAIQQAIEAHNDPTGRRGCARVTAKLGVGFTADAVCRWASGLRRPGIPKAVRIQDVLGIPVEAWVQAVTADL
jgi:hypothetical protein